MTTVVLLDTRTSLLELTGAVVLDFASELEELRITGTDEEAPVAFDNTIELEKTALLDDMTVLDDMRVLDDTLALDISETLDIPLDTCTDDLSTQFRSIESGS